MRNGFSLFRIQFILITLTLVVCQSGYSQGADYFQQKVDYVINAKLDDKKHTLSGDIEITYQNKSNQPLSEIRMHLWANAHSSRTTALNKQKLRSKDAKLYFADDKMLGGYNDLAFTINGNPAIWKLNAKNPDIASIQLPQPLAPGSSIIITTPFTLKIPGSFSRLGRVGTSYQMTQWYPKPAVFDKDGWHDMPYLDAGEFFSEFGDYKVSLTLPDNYVVGATGQLETEQEVKFLEEKIKESNTRLLEKINEKKDSFPASSPNMKTIVYTAKGVHDFAWFADKRYYVQRDTAVLKNGKRIPCYVMFSNHDAALWKNAASYVRRAVEFYSEEVGEYPWPHATAIQSALSAGAGMEYPMITVIGDASGADDLDEVITHEVGHNWFYGILASNERDHAWLDEGLNTFYEFKYMKKYYGGSAAIDGSLPGFMKRRLHGNLLQQGVRFVQRQNTALPPDTHSDDFSQMQYGLMSYMKPAALLQWLEQSVGEEKLQLIMQDYFQTWKFRHPGPNDFRAILQKHGVKEGWLFDQLQTQKTTDYRLISVKKTPEGITATISNVGELESPLPVSAIEKGHVVSTKWFEGFAGTKEVFLPCPNADAVMIDADDITIDLNRRDNCKPVKGMTMPGVGFLQAVENPMKPSVLVAPWLAWNHYDKTIIGAALYNAPFPGQKFQYYLLPGFATGSKSMTGIGEMTYRYFPKGAIQYVQFGLQGRTFHFDYNWPFESYKRFTKLAPSVTIHIPKTNGSGGQTLRARAIYINKEALDFDSIGMFAGKVNEKWPIYELSYTLNRNPYPNPYTVNVQLEQQSYQDAFARDADYLKLTASIEQKVYFNVGRKINIRFFGGYFLRNTARKVGSIHSELARGSLSLLPQGFADYKFDQTYLGRSDDQGVLARQVYGSDGGFKAAFGAPYANEVGYSNDFVLSMNVMSDLPKDLPLHLPLKPYFDIGYFSDARQIASDKTIADQIIWSGGFALSLLKGNAEIYFPVVSSRQLSDRYKEAGTDSGASSGIVKYLSWISWRVNLHGLHPEKLKDSLSH